MSEERVRPMKAIGFAGFSGSGKTSLIERVIPLLTGRGLKVSVLKHAHHTFDIDKPGKDSFRHREAGATEVIMVSARRWVVMHESRGEDEPSMEDMLSRFGDCDLVLVEGYKFGDLPKIEVFREQFAGAQSAPLMFASDPRVVAVATDSPQALMDRAASLGKSMDNLVQLDLNDPQDVASFIVRHFGLYEDTLTA